MLRCNTSIQVFQVESKKKQNNNSWQQDNGFNK